MAKYAANYAGLISDKVDKKGGMADWLNLETIANIFASQQNVSGNPFKEFGYRFQPILT